MKSLTRGSHPNDSPCRLSTLLLLSCLAAAPLSGCQTTNATNDSANTLNLSVGDNEIGEPCRATSAALDDNQTTETAAAYKVYCGDWEEASGNIVRFSTSETALSLAESSDWRQRLNSFANCEAPVETAVLDGIPAVALDCTFQAGGWPYQGLVVKLGEEIYLAGSIPVAYPSVERAIGAISGRLEVVNEIDSAKISDEIRRIEARIAYGRYSAGELARFQDLLRLAQYYNFQGNHTEAENRYREAIKLQERVSPEDRGGLGFLYMHLALELSNQQRFELADALFEKADELVPYSLEPTDEARLVSYRAIHLANQGKDEGAVELSRTATQMRQQLARQHGYRPGAPSLPRAEFAGVVFISPRRDREGSASIVGSRTSTAIGDVVQSQVVEAAMLIDLGQLDEAERVLANAMEILEQQPEVPRRWIPQVLLLQAQAAASAGAWNRAERLLTASIATQSSLFTESQTEGLAYLELGRVYMEQGQQPEALAAFRTGFTLLGDYGAKLAYDDVLPFFATAFATITANPRLRPELSAEMLEVAQMVQGPVASETMALTASRLASSEQEVGSLIRSLQNSKRRRDELLETITLVRSDPAVLAPQIAQLEKEWGGLNKKVADLELRIQSAEPRYNQLIDKPATAKDVIESLRPGEALVQILVGSEGATGFLVDQNGVEAYAIDLRETEAKEQVESLRRSFEVTDSLPAFPVSDAYALYTRLLKPIEPRITDVDHLIIVPNGPFLSLPFSLLVLAEPPEIQDHDYSDVSWMGHRYALTLGPSVQSFVNLRNTVQPSRATKALVGFGDYVPFGQTEGLLRDLDLPETCRGSAQAIAEASPLPSTAVELKNVYASLQDEPKGRLVLGNAFTVEAVESMDLSEYRIVYFATHALLPHQVRCFAEPALLASRGNATSTADDTLLTTSEIVDLKMDADLVVLSACNTGGPGGETGGESLSGLARAFFYAGARSMLVTHWQVPDKPTSMLMADTFARLATENTTFAQALRDSQIAFVKQNPHFSHPLAWASFTVVGDGGQRLSRQGVAETISGDLAVAAR